MSIQPNTFVRLTTDPSRAGVVQNGEKIMAGEKMVPVQFPDGRVSWLPMKSLEPVTMAPPDLTDRFADGRFVGPAWLQRTLTRIRVTGRLSDVIYSMEATETDFYAFQFKPVLKLLGSPTDALLIADEVGLGKTIEAGLIWTELRARFESNRLLVICPKTLCEKWRIELDRRFGVDARIVNAEELSNLFRERRHDGRGFAAVASMQGLRPPKGWDSRDKSNQPMYAGTRRRFAQMLRDEADGEPMIDLLVVDEAHHMRNPDTLLNRLGRLLNAVSVHRIFLSATPIHLRSRDLHSLLRLIDPNTFEYGSTVDDLIRTNEPIIGARDLLLKPNTSQDEIIECVEAARQFGLLTESKALKLLREDLEKKPLDEASRAELASRLESVNQMANYMTRTKRRDVEQLRIVREPKTPHLTMHAEERNFYNAVTVEIVKYSVKREINWGFLLSTSLRLLTSSPAAASAYWAGLNLEEERDEIEETDDDLRPQSDELNRPLRTNLARLARKLDRTERLEKVDTKFQLLWWQLLQLWESEPNAKVIVFSGFIPTLKYLRRRLKTNGVYCELLHGSVHEPREVILNRFRDNPRARVLLSSEVGSEGIDLQFCWIVVNYDLPWNPMRVEQRIGRVDRLGQEKSKVTVLNLIYEHTIDSKIYHRLYKRLGLIKRALGEFEAVLGEPIREMTQKLLDGNLSEEQQEEVIDQTAQAIENKRLEEESLEQDAGALIRHGDYILQKIDEGRDRNRWLSSNDILLYVKDRLNSSFSGCNIEASPPGSATYRITLSSESRDKLAGFIAQRNLRGRTRLLQNDSRQRYQFTRSVARREEHRIEYISQLHPLVRFAVELDSLDEEASETQPVAASVGHGQLTFDCKSGLHVIAIRRLDTNPAGGRVGSWSRLAYIGSELVSSELMSPEDAEAMAGAAANHGHPLLNFKHDPRLPAATKVLRSRVLPELDRLYEEILKRTKAGIDDRAAIQQQALKRHRDTKARRLADQHDKFRRDAVFAEALGNSRRSQQLRALAAATNARIRKLNNRVELRLKQIEQQRTFAPEWSDVTCLLVEVTQ